MPVTSFNEDKLSRCEFAVVKFPDEDDCLSVVPMNWLVKSRTGDTHCKWPPAGISIKKAVKNQEKPTDDWHLFSANVVHLARTYKSANTYLQKSQYNSEVDMFSSSDVDRSAKRSRFTEASMLEEVPSTSVTSSNKELHRLEAKLDILLKGMAEIKAELAETKDLLKSSRQATVCDIDLYLENFKQLQTLEDIQDFELKIKDDAEFAVAIKQCGCIGGKDYADATRRILNTMFSHDMAMKLSWSNTNGKISIQKFPSMLLFIKVALRSNKAFKDVPQNAMEEVIKRWFRYAPDRNGGRMERLKKSTNAN